MVFMISTYGEGGPSDDCMEFNKQLEKKSKGKSAFFEDFSNTNLHYSIFGLGSSKYEYFNQMAKNLDAIFTKHGIKRITEVGLGDDSKNINEDFQNWRKNFWSQNFKYFNENSERINKLVIEMNLAEIYETQKQETEITIDDSIIIENKIDVNDYDFSMRRFLQSEECKIEEISELRKENINGSTLKIVYSLENTNLKYEVGDNIGVYPTNNELSVMSIISRLNFNPSSFINVRKLKNETKKKISIPSGMTIKEILTNLVDLSCHVNKSLLEKLLKFCLDEDQYDNIQMLMKKENKLNEYLSKNYNIVDFLNTYDSINIPFIEFYELMPKITPRFYTVASSPNFRKNKMEIIISLLEWKGINNQSRYGITSNYYKNLYEMIKLNSEGNNLNNYTTRIIVRESNFRIPKNPSQPIIMICTGTGIAPFVSFFQEFDYQMNKTENKIEENFYQNNTLIFGSKNKKFDFIYENELNEYQNKKIIKSLHTAFSRDQDKKMYVQHLIENLKNDIENLILDETSVIYICGGVSMGAEVVDVLEKHYTKEFIKKIESEGRLIKELWG